MNGNENITQNVTTIIPENLDKTSFDEKKKCTNNKERDAYISPINNILAGLLSTFLGLISDSSIK